MISEPKILYLPVADWVKVPDNPSQRDTERHAKRALPYLAKDTPAHDVVIAGSLPDGKLIKIDGHTRAHLWAEDLIPRPKQVMVVVFPIETLAEAVELYETYDNPSAGKDAIDRVTGAFSYLGFHPLSTFFKSGRGSNILSVAEAFRSVTHNARRINPIAAIQEWRTELEHLDRMLEECPTANKAHTGILAAALLTLRKHPKAANMFWHRYFTVDEGLTTDPVIALKSFVATRVAKHQHIGLRNTFTIAETAISVFEKAREGEGSITRLRPVECINYLVQVPKKLRRQEPERLAPTA